MGRILTAGAETGSLFSDGFVANSTQIASTTSQARSGSRSFGGAFGDAKLTLTGAIGTTYFARVYLLLTGSPAIGADVLAVKAGANGFSVRLATDKTLQLVDSANTPLGAQSSVLNTGQWYRVDFRSRFVVGAADEYEWRLDGVSKASGTSTITDSAATVFIMSSDTNVFLDDIALNDNGGASQNSWPDDAKVVLLLPTADSAKGTGWQKPGGSTTNLFTSVDNVPPVGVADSTNAAQAENQIRNATSAANSNYDATMTTYTDAGIGAADTINVVVPIVETAAPVSTGAKQGTVGVASNPTIANVALAAGGTSGAFWSGAAANTFATGWKFSAGTATYAPSVTLGTAPVMRITQVTSSTRIADVCFMGMYVDYTPAVVAARVPYSSPYPQLLAH